MRITELLRKLELDEKRIGKADGAGNPPIKPIAPARTGVPQTVAATVSEPDVQDRNSDLAIPEFLRARPRGSVDLKDPDTFIDAVCESLEDHKAAEALEAEVVEQKKAKARGRIAKLKAKQSGELRKMPLSGRAALAHIKNG